MGSTVYVDGVEETGAFNVSFSPMMNAISSARFQIKNIHLQAAMPVYATWKARIDTAIITI